MVLALFIRVGVDWLDNGYYPIVPTRFSPDDNGICVCDNFGKQSGIRMVESKMPNVPTFVEFIDARMEPMRFVSFSTRCNITSLILNNFVEENAVWCGPSPFNILRGIVNDHFLSVVISGRNQAYHHPVVIEAVYIMGEVVLIFVGRPKSCP